MKRPAVFFDRDNTLIACDGYLGDPAKVVLVEGAAEAVSRVRSMGFSPVVFSNQSGVARGMFPEEAVHAVNARLDELLHEESPQAVIDRHDFCPYHPGASVERYRMDSDLRKPKPGMIYLAASVLDLDLSRSWVVGDAPRDIAAGHTAGLRTVLLKIASLPPSPATQEGSGISPDFVATSLEEAIDFIEQNRVADPAGLEQLAEVRNGQYAGGAPTPLAKTLSNTPAAADSSDDAWTASPSPVVNAPVVNGSSSSASSPNSMAMALPDPPAVPPQLSSTPVKSSASLTSLNPVRTEVPVKLTPRPHSKLEPAQSARPEAVKPDGTKPENTRPVQGGFVVKPTHPPNITWGERMRLAKEGSGTVYHPTAGKPTQPAVKPAVEKARAVEPVRAAEPPREVEPPPVEVHEPEVALEPEPSAVIRDPEPSHGQHPQEVQDASEDIAGEASTAETYVHEDLNSAEDESPEREPMKGQLLPHDLHGTEMDRVDQPRVTVMPRESGNPVIADTSRVEELLEQVLVELRRGEEQASLDFSVSKLLAGITQVMSLAALFFAYLNRGGNDLLPTLLVALTLQTLTISLLIMGRQK